MLRRVFSVRTGLTLLGCVAVFTGPVALAVGSMILLSIRFRAWETLLIGLFIDLLWHPSADFLSPLPLFTILAIILVWGLEPLRRELLITA